jgi:hypothetical protein
MHCKKVDAVDFLVNMSRELAWIAKRYRLPTELHLLEMAYLQAATTFEALAGRPHALARPPPPSPPLEKG